MTTFIDALTGTVRSGVCSYLNAYNNFNDALYGNDGLIGAIPRAAGRTAYRMLCNTEPPPEPPPLVPGGQCVNIPYKWQVQFEWSGNAYDNNWLAETVSNFTQPSTKGAIGALRKVGGAGNWSLRFDSGDGEVVVFSHTSGSPIGFRNYRFTQIYRQDGQPDNCGVLPSPVPPPDSPTVNTNTSYITNNNTSVNIPLVLTYAPVNINLDGHLNMPVRVHIPVDAEVTFNANVDFNTGDIEFNFNDSNYSPGCKNPPSGYDTPTGTPDPPPDVPIDIPSPSPDDPEPETIRLLRAAIVTVNIVPDGITEIFQDDNPNVFIPRLGNVQFLIRVGNRLAWTEEIPVKNKRQFIVCPWEGGAIDVRGTPQPNVVWTISPVYAIQEQTVSFE